MINSIVIIESELQLRNFVQYVSKNSCSGYFDLIVRYNGVKDNDQRIDSSLQCHKNLFRKIYRFKAKRQNKFDFFCFLVKFYWMFFFPMKFGHVYVGDYRSKWMKILYKRNFEKVFFLDDGLATINFYNALNEGRISINNPFSLISNLGITSTDNVDVISLSSTKTTKKNMTPNVIFIGMGLVEGGYMSEIDYILAFKKVLNAFKDRTIEYIPHRVESTEKIEGFINDYSLIINKIDCPIEEYVINIDTCPELICSFYSTALINLANTVSGPEIISFVLNKSELHLDIRDKVMDVYSYFNAHKNIIVREI